MLKRKDGRWQEQIKLPGMDKPKYFYGKTQREVKQKMAAWNREQDAEKEKAVQFCAILGQWEERHREEVSASTWANYRAPIRDVVQRFEGREIGDIYVDEIREFLDAVAARGYSRRTVQMRRDVLVMVWDYAIEKRLAQYNVARQARMPKGLPEGTREPPTPEQMQKMQAGFRLPFGLYAALECYTGMRRGEILALQWDDFDRAAGVIRVRRAVEYISSTPRLKVPKTKKGFRDVVILEPLAALLPNRKHGLVFPGPDGGILRRGQFSTQWRKWCGAVGLEVGRNKAEVTTHQLRHFYASMLYEAGVGIKDAQNLLGHANVQTTMNVYTHISERHKQATADKLNEFLCQNPVEREKSEENQRVLSTASAESKDSDTE